MLLLSPSYLFLQLRCTSVINIREYSAAVIRMTRKLALEIVGRSTMKQVTATRFLQRNEIYKFS